MKIARKMTSCIEHVESNHLLVISYQGNTVTISSQVIESEEQ